MPSAAELRELIEENCPGMQDEQIVSQFLTGLSNVISADPSMYRSYGPFWPALKTLAISQGENNYGTKIDTDIVAAYSYDEDVLTIAAALTYHDDRINQGLQTSTRHMLPANDYDYYEFNYIDEEMERLIMIKNQYKTNN